MLGAGEMRMAGSLRYLGHLGPYVEAARGGCTHDCADIADIRSPVGCVPCVRKAGSRAGENDRRGLHKLVSESTRYSPSTVSDTPIIDTSTVSDTDSSSTLGISDTVEALC